MNEHLENFAKLVKAMRDEQKSGGCEGHEDERVDEALRQILELGIVPLGC